MPLISLAGLAESDGVRLVVLALSATQPVNAVPIRSNIAPRGRDLMTFPPKNTYSHPHVSFFAVRCQYRSEEAALPAGRKEKAREAALRRANGISGEIGER